MLLEVQGSLEEFGLLPVELEAVYAVVLVAVDVFVAVVAPALRETQRPRELQLELPSFFSFLRPVVSIFDL